MNKKLHAMTRLFGLSFEEWTVDEIQEALRHAWQEKKTVRITTINPEFIVRAQRDTNFLHNLQSADIRLVDGFGLWWVLCRQGFRGVRITGADLVPILLKQAKQDEKQVKIVLREKGLQDTATLTKVLTEQFPHLRCEIVFENERGREADLCLFALGAPEQEYRAQEEKYGVAMGVGGALDFLTGAQRRAPRWMREWGLEWLWRLIHQPTRLQRILNATLIFCFLSLREIVRQKRKNIL